MTTPNRWAIREVAEATFYSLKAEDAGKAICTLNTLKTSGIETSGEITYSRGGRGNAKLVGFSSNREAKLKMEDAIFDNDAVAMLTGNDLVSGTKLIDWFEIVTVDATHKATLSKTPSGKLVSVYKLRADGTNETLFVEGSSTPAAGEYVLDTKELTFNASDAPEGTKFKVYYKVTTASDAKQIKVSSDAFGGTFRVVLDCLVKDEFTQQDYRGQIMIPNAKFEETFAFTFAATGDPAVLALNMDILKDPVSTDMWEMVIFDDQGIV